MMTAVDRCIIPTNAFLRKPQSPITSHACFQDEPDNNVIDYRLESVRLDSYYEKKWPVTWMEPKKLAAAGFYYTGKDDIVKCFECKVEISKWETNDNPMVDHQRWSSRCRFVNNVPCGNVPIGVDPSTVPTPSPKGVDVCGPYMTFMSYSDQENEMVDDVTLNLYKFSGPLSKPKHPQFASYEARVNTFETWPKSLKQTKQDLANAGFYYTGMGDQTLCYYCGGGLRDWDPEDIPWEQHAKWFEYCPYLIACKGRDYISKVTGRTYFTLDNKSCEPEAEEAQKSVDKSEKADEDEASGSSSQKSEDTDIESVSSASSESSIDKKPNPPYDENQGDYARMCKICYLRELRTVFIPCGHLLACAECALNMKTCGVCRKPVQVTVQAYIP